MQAVAKVKNVRYGVRKLRRVVDLVRGKSVDEAFAMLSILSRTPSSPLSPTSSRSLPPRFPPRNSWSRLSLPMVAPS